MRVTPIVAGLVLSMVGTAAAEEATVGVTDEAPDYASKVEGNMFVGAFIADPYHQFYSSDQDSQPRRKLDRWNGELGLRYARFFSRMVGIEAEGSIVGANRADTGDGVQIYGLGGQFIFQLPKRVTPFLALGGMWRHSRSETLGTDNDATIHAGLGLKFWLSQRIALRFDARYMRGPSYPHPADDPSYTLNADHGELTVGITWNGKSTAKPVAVVAPVDPDPDKDGIAGMADECPQEHGGGNEDGCPTRDKDGDGIADAMDKCADQAETVNKFEDTDGCPDTVPDTDADGLDDLVDMCKDQAEDKDSFKDEDGCPDADNDEDGVVDAKDKCVNEKGVVENAGCPDTDGDGDTVVDRLDNCPTEKGDPKNQGCKAKQLVVITKDQLKILDTVRFVTGSARLSPASNKLLDNIAKVLIAHTEIAKVKVEGHTDNVGKPEKNLKLSQDRAASVVKYLVKKGVLAERLEAVGHGDTKPVADNKTAKGKAANRRVEFNIVNE